MKANSIRSADQRSPPVSCFLSRASPLIQLLPARGLIIINLLGRNVMKKAVFLSAILAALVISGSIVYAGGNPPSPPGQPTTGYGSSAGYICNSLYDGRPINMYHAIDIGDEMAGSECWIYIPSQLKNGSTAPVVVYLHGMFLIVPEIYNGQIEHLVRQGYIVIFPEYNKAWTGLLSDMDQYQMLDRAIAAVNTALALPAVSSRAEMNNIYLAGHSNGGNLSLCWAARGGVPVKSITLQHPCTSMEAVPSIVRDMFMGDMVMLDYQAMAASITCPVILIGGTSDTIATPGQLGSQYQSLVNASSKVLYFYSDDSHGEPELLSDHVAPCQDDGLLPGWLLDMMSMMSFSEFEQDSVDYRVHYAALDAALAGQTRVLFDRGTWSDGTAVKPVKTAADSTVTAVTVYQHASFAGAMAQLPVGSYKLADLEAYGIANDDLSSVRVPAGRTVILYKDNNFSGSTRVLTADEDNFVDIGFNDVVSSIKVQ